jgi:hypothetical protein
MSTEDQQGTPREDSAGAEKCWRCYLEIPRADFAVHYLHCIGRSRVLRYCALEVSTGTVHSRCSVDASTLLTPSLSPDGEYVFFLDRENRPTLHHWSSGRTVTGSSADLDPRKYHPQHWKGVTDSLLAADKTFSCVSRGGSYVVVAIRYATRGLEGEEYVSGYYVLFDGALQPIRCSEAYDSEPAFLWEDGASLFTVGYGSRPEGNWRRLFPRLLSDGGIVARSGDVIAAYPWAAVSPSGQWLLTIRWAHFRPQLRLWRREAAGAFSPYPRNVSLPWSFGRSKEYPGTIYPAEDIQGLNAIVADTGRMIAFGDDWHKWSPGLRLLRGRGGMHTTRTNRARGKRIGFIGDGHLVAQSGGARDRFDLWDSLGGVRELPAGGSIASRVVISATGQELWYLSDK